MTVWYQDKRPNFGMEKYISFYLVSRGLHSRFGFLMC